VRNTNAMLRIRFIRMMSNSNWRLSGLQLCFYAPMCSLRTSCSPPRQVQGC
jgi:hypothetical protein